MLCVRVDLVFLLAILRIADEDELLLSVCFLAKIFVAFVKSLVLGGDAVVVEVDIAVRELIILSRIDFFF